MSKAKIKITVQRMATVGALSKEYRIQQIHGSAQIEITGRVKDAPTKTFLVGDTCNHEELLRLHEVTVYDITTKTP